MKNKSFLPWGCLFLFILFLSQDYLFITWDERPGLMGFPNWLLWFVFVHLLFIGAFYWFAQKYWKE